MFAYKTLKSGTDIRGVASEGGGAPINLTDEVIERIAAGFLVWCEKHLNKAAAGLKIAVGHDSRISADRISAALCRVFTACGASVSDCGLASTPSMFMATLELPCDCSVQITASHHPFYRNGLKFFTPAGGLDSPDISEILEYAEAGASPEKKEGGSVTTVHYMQKYAENLRAMIQKGVSAEDYEHPLNGFKIVVDAGNGAGGFYATEVLEPLGADITGSQFLDPDGRFPNHIPNPENEEAMASVCAATVRAGADLGVIFDTDVDRGGAVDSRGEEINRNRLVAIASAIALEGNAGGTIVTDSITSDGLKTYIEETLGGHHHRFKRGYKNVINEAIRLNNEGVNCPLAIETSGHAALRENYFLDDGAYLVTKIIIKAAQLSRAGQSLESLIADLKEAKEEKELRFPITTADFRPVGEGIIAALERYAEDAGWAIAPDNREGIRISFPENDGDGWFLLRMSVHDPILPLNLESNTVGGVHILAEKLLAFFEQADTTYVDYTSLQAFLNA
ncbi:phosphomannomutase/phosphoglucomutase [Anaeromassilibacillus senegalensis]|uniref:Phosphomannomutase/phosphoglucomutase n=1 Tax=Anaeromassilibacillus senegalensis TaxID=1673717 RepID=A0ABS9CM99_9FIRM|nr:phosphomannomutase/phosphoglucomutase [Anaeromassilibacillus senegalensis]MCF2652184.1 phosphomannomutase/phosphoglucomutase [Anaeromassilibacillus senegalensis]